MMEYKGYTGQITTVYEDQGLIHGRVAGLVDVITFEGKTFEELVQAFQPWAEPRRKMERRPSVSALVVPFSCLFDRPHRRPFSRKL
jgi:hypothetical protein